MQINPARVAPPTVVAAHLGRTRSDREAIWAGKVRPATATLPAERSEAKRKSESIAPVATAAQIEEVQAILNRLVNEYLSRTSGRKAQWQASFRVDVADVAKVLSAKSPLECSGGSYPWTGKQRLAISFTGEKGPVRVSVYADVTATQPVVVAIQPIDRGHVLTAADVEVQQWENVPMKRGREPVEYGRIADRHGSHAVDSGGRRGGARRRPIAAARKAGRGDRRVRAWRRHSGPHRGPRSRGRLPRRIDWSRIAGSERAVRRRRDWTCARRSCFPAARRRATRKWSSGRSANCDRSRATHVTTCTPIDLEDCVARRGCLGDGVLGWHRRPGGCPGWQSAQRTAGIATSPAEWLS